MDNVICLFCRASNTPDAYFCSNCERSLVVAKLTSLGTGVLTKGFVWEMRPKEITLGRNIGNDFVIPSNLIAGEQLRFNFRGDGFTVRDVSGRGNCALNDATLADETPLSNGNVLRVGVEEFVYNYTKPSAEKVTKIPDPTAGQLQLMLGIISEFHASLNLQEVLDNAVDAVLRLTRTQRGYCFMIDETESGDAELREVAARKSGGKPMHDGRNEDGDEGYTISQSMIQQVMESSGAIVVEDAMAQNVNTETVRKFKLKSIICVPMMTYNSRSGRKHVMGVIYCDSPNPTGELPKHCLPTLQMLSEIITATVVKWQNYDRMEQRFQDFERTLGQLDLNLDAVCSQIQVMQSRVSEPEQVKRIAREEIILELASINARVQAVRMDLHRLQFLPQK